MRGLSVGSEANARAVTVRTAGGAAMCEVCFASRRRKHGLQGGVRAHAVDPSAQLVFVRPFAASAAAAHGAAGMARRGEGHGRSGFCCIGLNFVEVHPPAGQLLARDLWTGGQTGQAAVEEVRQGHLRHHLEVRPAVRGRVRVQVYVVAKPDGVVHLVREHVPPVRLHVPAVARKVRDKGPVLLVQQDHGLVAAHARHAHAVEPEVGRVAEAGRNVAVGHQVHRHVHRCGLPRLRRRGPRDFFERAPAHELARAAETGADDFAAPVRLRRVEGVRVEAVHDWAKVHVTAEVVQRAGALALWSEREWARLPEVRRAHEVRAELVLLAHGQAARPQERRGFARHVRTRNGVGHCGRRHDHRPHVPAVGVWRAQPAGKRARVRSHDARGGGVARPLLARVCDDGGKLAVARAQLGPRAGRWTCPSVRRSRVAVLERLAHPHPVQVRLLEQAELEDGERARARQVRCQSVDVKVAHRRAADVDVQAPRKQPGGCKQGRGHQTIRHELK